MASCPAGNPIVDFLASAGKGEMKKALEALKFENPLPAVCGRVCPHPCTGVCNRNELDEPVSVNIVERLVGDTEIDHGLCLPRKAPRAGKSVAVIGSGPAGLTCAYHCALLGHDVTIFESESKPGGLLKHGIPDYRLPSEILERELSFIKELGIKLHTDSKIVNSDFEKLTAKYDALCISTGAGKSPGSGINGEKLDRIFGALDFLKIINSGKEMAVGKNVVVIGGGNSAIDAARAAVRSKGSAVVYYRRGREDMPAFDDEIQEAIEEGVRFEFYCAPVKIKSSQGRLLSVVMQRMEPGEPDESGRARPVPINGSEFEVPADSLIEAVGANPDIPIDEINPGEIDDWGTTNIEKCFVCGDAGPGNRTVAHAIGSGKRTAIAIDCFLKGADLDKIKSRILIGRSGAVSMKLYRENKSAPDPDSIIGIENINLAYFKKSPAAKPHKIDIDSRKRGYNEINLVDAGDAETEAGRCFHCGSCNECGNCLLFCPDISIIERAYEGSLTPDYDSDYCKGCGICARECPRGIITMVEEEQ